MKTNNSALELHPISPGARSAFVHYIEQEFTVSKGLREYLTRHTYTISVPPNTVLVHAGQPSGGLYAVLSGGIRYYQEWAGHSISKALFLNGCVAPHPIDVYYQFPLLQQLRSIGKTTLSFIEHEHIVYAVKMYAEVRDVLPQLLIQARNIDQQRNQWEKWLPKRKLQFVLKENPKICSLVPKNVLASYLGISPEHLSRISRELKAGVK